MTVPSRCVCVCVARMFLQTALRCLEKRNGLAETIYWRNFYQVIFSFFDLMMFVCIFCFPEFCSDVCREFLVGNSWSHWSRMVSQVSHGLAWSRMVSTVSAGVFSFWCVWTWASRVLVFLWTWKVDMRCFCMVVALQHFLISQHLFPALFRESFTASCFCFCKIIVC